MDNSLYKVGTRKKTQVPDLRTGAASPGSGPARLWGEGGLKGKAGVVAPPSVSSWARPPPGTSCRKSLRRQKSRRGRVLLKHCSTAFRKHWGAGALPLPLQTLEEFPGSPPRGQQVPHPSTTSHSVRQEGQDNGSHRVPQIPEANMTRAQKQCVMSLEGQNAVSRVPYRPSGTSTFQQHAAHCFAHPALHPKLHPLSLTGYWGLPTSLAMSSKPITAECTTDSAMAVPPVPHLLLCPASRRHSSWGNSPRTGMVAQLLPTPTLLPPRPPPAPVAPSCTLSRWLQVQSA